MYFTDNDQLLFSLSSISSNASLSSSVATDSEATQAVRRSSPQSFQTYSSGIETSMTSSSAVESVTEEPGIPLEPVLSNTSIVANVGMMSQVSQDAMMFADSSVACSHMDTKPLTLEQTNVCKVGDLFRSPMTGQ